MTPELFNYMVNKKNKIWLYDTTLRDGTQMEGISLSAHDKVLIARRLDEFGMHYIEGGWPGSNPKDMTFFEEIRKVDLKNSKIAAFGSTRRANTPVKEDKQVQTLLDAETPVVTVFGKSWDLHVTDVFKTTLEENLKMISDTVAFLKSKKKEVIYDAEHFFDGYKANPEYALKSLKAAAAAGADNITLCDTNGGTLPEEIAALMEVLKKEIKTPMGIHCHNDSELGVANSLAALRGGAVLIQGTVNGIGERCGNANLVSILANAQLKMGCDVLPEVKVKALTALSHYIAEVCNQNLLNNQPFTGRSAFAHKGGVHIDAMVKNQKTYEHLNPEKIGNTRHYLVSELGGRTNILLKSKELDLDLKKDAPETKKILSEIQKLENEGYQFEAAEASFEVLVKKTLGTFKPFFKVKSVSVRSENIGGGKPKTVAEVEITAKGKDHSESAEGDGPVNALDQAFRKALKGSYPEIETIHLTDYKVRVVNSQAGTAAKVRVFIEFQDENDKTWTTVGVHENIIEASWKALVEAIEYKLLKS